jgi:hypothetical protein
LKKFRAAHPNSETHALPADKSFLINLKIAAVLPQQPVQEYKNKDGGKAAAAKLFSAVAGNKGTQPIGHCLLFYG